MVIPFLPPSINGLGQFGGFTYELLDQSGGPIENLAAAAQQLIGASAIRRRGWPGCSRSSPPTIRSSSSTSIASRPRASACRSATITDTMQILLGSAYVNDFDFNNRSYRVYVQADQQFRANPERHRALLRADRRRRG